METTTQLFKIVPYMTQAGWYSIHLRLPEYCAVASSLFLRPDLYYGYCQDGSAAAQQRGRNMCTSGKTQVSI